MKNNTIFIFIFNCLFFNQSSNALSNTHSSFLNNNYLLATIPRQSGHEGGCLARDNDQTPSPIESWGGTKKPFQSKNLEMQEVIQSLQKMLASQGETLQTKEKLLQTTQTDLQDTRIFAKHQRREIKLIRAQLAFLEQKNREAEEEKEALQKALDQSKRKHAKAQNLIKKCAKMDSSILDSLDAISFTSEPQCRANDEGKDNSTPKVSSQSGSQSQPTDYLKTVFDVPDFDAQDFDPQQEWEEDF